MFGRRYHGSKQQDRLPKGEDDRASVDWMDFGEKDGGPTRNVVHLGTHDMKSRRDALGQGEAAGDDANVDRS